MIRAVSLCGLTCDDVVFNAATPLFPNHYSVRHSITDNVLSDDWVPAMTNVHPTPLVLTDDVI